MHRRAYQRDIIKKNISKSEMYKADENLIDCSPMMIRNDLKYKPNLCVTLDSLCSFTSHRTVVTSKVQEPQQNPQIACQELLGKRQINVAGNIQSSA